MLIFRLEANSSLIIANVQSSLFLYNTLSMLLIFLILIIGLIDPSDFLTNVQFDAFGFEIETPKSLDTCNMDTSGDDDRGNPAEDSNSYGEAGAVSASGGADPSATSPTDSATSELADLHAECERFKELHDNAVERSKVAIAKGDLNSAAEAAKEIQTNKTSYFSQLDKLNKEEDSNGYPKTDSEITRDTGTSNNVPSDDGYFAESDDSRPTTPDESTKPGFVKKKK